MVSVVGCLVAKGGVLIMSSRALNTGTESLVELARRIKGGDILLPKFQRAFVWNRKQVLELLDSVARDYPIGSVLLWQSREELASDRTIANLEISPPRPDYPHNYLLDGQQRLSTICGALYWTPDGDPASYWNIVYDLEAGQFAHVSAFDERLPHQIPARLLSDGAAYFRSTAANLPEHREKADTLYRRFQDYKIAVATITDMDVDEVAKVFERINSTATKLTIADLIRAATWTSSFDLADLLDDASSSLAAKQFDTVEPPTLLRVIAAAGGHGYDSTDIDKLRRHSSDELRGIIAKASEGARRAADFLATDLGLPGARALPYDNQFVVLADVFHRIERPSAAQVQALQRWFWRTSFGGYFSGWQGKQMVAVRDAVKDFASGTVHELEPAGTLPGESAWRDTRFRQGAAFSKAHALLLARHEPVDLRSLRPIDTGKALSWSNDKEYHHFFPQAYLKKQQYSETAINSVANIIMLTSITNIHISDQRPSEYLQELIDMHGEQAMRDACEQSLIPPAAFDAALVNDYDTFLKARAAHLCARAQDLVGVSTTASP